MLFAFVSFFLEKVNRKKKKRRAGKKITNYKASDCSEKQLERYENLITSTATSHQCVGQLNRATSRDGAK